MFHHVHGKNVILSADSSQATRINGFCQAITFSNSPLTQLQRTTFQILSDSVLNTTNQTPTSADSNFTFIPNSSRSNRKSKKPLYNGCLRIGLTCKNPITFTELPILSYPFLLNTDGFWITTVKPSYLKTGNKISLVLDKNNNCQLFVNYVLKASLFGNKMINLGQSAKLWLILDLYGTTTSVQFLPSDYTPYEIKARGLNAVNNFHSACLSGGSKSIFKTRLIILGQEGCGKTALRNLLINHKNSTKSIVGSKLLRNAETSASIRVKVMASKSSNLWHLKNINRNEYSSDETNKSLKLRRQNSNLDHNYLGLPITIKSTNDLNDMNSVGSRFNKRRSSSTSYLNEKDDYNDDPQSGFYSGEYLKKFSRQLSLEENDEQNNKNDSNGEINNDNSNLNNDSNQNENENSSDDSSVSDHSDNESNADLYAIDECDELIQTLDNSIDHKSNITNAKINPKKAYFMF